MLTSVESEWLKYMRSCSLKVIRVLGYSIFLTLIANDANNEEENEKAENDRNLKQKQLTGQNDLFKLKLDLMYFSFFCSHSASISVLTMYLAGIRCVHDVSSQ